MMAPVLNARNIRSKRCNESGTPSPAAALPARGRKRPGEAEDAPAPAQALFVATHVPARAAMHRLRRKV